MKSRFLTLLLAFLLLVGTVGCQNTAKPVDATSVSTEDSTAPQHKHSFQPVVVTKQPCIVAGEGERSCFSCDAKITVPLPATGEHLFRDGVCLGCGQNKIPLTAVSSVYDANRDGQKDIYYFSPQLTDRFDNAVHVGAGEYDKSLSSETVSTTTAAGIPHWYVTYGQNQYIVYRVNVPEAGLYEMAVHFRMKDEQLRSAKYTINGGTEQEEIFETSHGFTGTDYEKVRDADTLTSYMYGITVNLVEGENIIRIEEGSIGDKTQHFRDFYFVKVGPTHRHVFENETVIKQNTCAKDGKTEAKCVCGLISLQTLPATGKHNFVNDVCADCGRKNVPAGIVHYDFLYDQPGFAGGTVEFCADVTDVYTFYWGDDNGRLENYSMLYSQQISASKTVKITIQSFTAIPKGATRLIAVGAKGSTYSYDIPENRRFDAKELYSFGALSDSHQGNRYGSQSIPYNHFIDAVKDLSQMGASMIGICGDFSYNNEEFEYQLHEKAIKELFAYNPKLPIYTVSGNHECKYTGFSKDWFLKYSRNVVDYDTTLLPIFSEGDDLDFAIELPDGSVMLYLNQIYYDYGKTTSRLLDDYQIEWLEARLEQYKDRTVFLFFHTFIDEEAGDASTAAGKEYSLPLISGTVEYKRFNELFTKYKNVVYFSGHSHQSFDLQFMKEKAGDKSNLYTNIDNNDGNFATMVHIPSVAATRSGNTLSDAKDRSEGYLVRMYEDYIVFEGYDFVNNQNFAYATYIISR